MKTAELTTDRFVDWLKRNPDRPLICESAEDCAVAQFVADELLEGDEKWVTVQGPTIIVDTEDGDWTEYTSPDWVTPFINAFDHYWINPDDDGLDGLSQYDNDFNTVVRTGAQTLALIEREGFGWLNV